MLRKTYKIEILSLSNYSSNCSTIWEYITDVFYLKEFFSHIKQHLDLKSRDLQLKFEDGEHKENLHRKHITKFPDSLLLYHTVLETGNRLRKCKVTISHLDQWPSRHHPILQIQGNRFSPESREALNRKGIRILQTISFSSSSDRFDSPSTLVIRSGLTSVFFSLWKRLCWRWCHTI